MEKMSFKVRLYVHNAFPPEIEAEPVPFEQLQDMQDIIPTYILLFLVHFMKVADKFNYESAGDKFYFERLS